MLDPTQRIEPITCYNIGDFLVLLDVGFCGRLCAF